MDLGANPIRVFLYLILPNVKNGLLVAALAMNIDSVANRLGWIPSY